MSEKKGGKKHKQIRSGRFALYTSAGRGPNPNQILCVCGCPNSAPATSSDSASRKPGRVGALRFRGKLCKWNTHLWEGGGGRSANDTDQHFSVNQGVSKRICSNQGFLTKNNSAVIRQGVSRSPKPEKNVAQPATPVVLPAFRWRRRRGRGGRGRGEHRHRTGGWHRLWHRLAVNK